MVTCKKSTKMVSILLLIALLSGFTVMSAFADEPTEDNFSGMGTTRANYYLVYGYAAQPYRVPIGTVVGYGYTTTGNYVKAVQDHANLINEEHVLDVDGIFGSATYTWVYNYQQVIPECGTPDGIVGAKTWAVLSNETV